MRYDVVIIGAGVSGLACAAALSDQSIAVVNFEARDVIGGRVRTFCPADGGPAIELGAQVIHGDRNPLRDLAAHGIGGLTSPASQRVPRTTAARAVLHGRVTSLGALARGGVPPWAAEHRLTVDGGGSGAAGQPAGRSSQNNQGLAGDDVSVAAWLTAQRITGDHLLAATEWFRQNWAAPPTALSARGVAAARRGDATGDGEYAFSDGYQALLETLAAGRDIRLHTPVRALNWAPGRVDLITGEGARITARAVVITAPPPVIVSELTITPMPERKTAAACALPSGDALCAIATMSRPADETAVVFDADGQSGFVRCTAGRPEVLIVAKAGAAATVRGVWLAGLVKRAFPYWTAPDVTDLRIADWGRDPWSAGAFSYPMVGAEWAGPAWAEPMERTVFFAGEATTAGTLPPTVHGAVASGVRAASEVLEAWGQ